MSQSTSKSLRSTRDNADRGHSGDRKSSPPVGGPVVEDMAALHSRFGNHAVSQLLAVGGVPLAAGVRAEMEARFGESLASVRVHHDARAHDLAETVDANAFTVGDVIVFNSHKFAPDQPSGKRLLAHEIAHVVQQRRGGALPSSKGMETIEAHADQAAGRVSSGLSARVAGASAPAVMCEKKRKNKSGSAVRRRPGETDEFDPEGENERKKAKERTLTLKQRRETAGKSHPQLAAGEAERQLQKLEKHVAAPGGNQRSQRRRLQKQKKYERMLENARGTQLDKNKRKGDFDEAQRTPRGPGVIAQPEYVAGGVKLPEQDFFDDRGRKVASHTRPDFSLYRRRADGSLERVHVNLKSNQIDQMTEAEARAAAREILYQAVKNKAHLPAGEKLIISFGHVPSPKIQGAIKSELFRDVPLAPIDEVRFGTIVHRESEYPRDGRHPLDVDAKARQTRLAQEKKKEEKAAAADKKTQTGGKSPETPLAGSSAAPKSTQAKGSKKPAAKKTAGQASAADKKAQTGGKPPKPPLAGSTAAPKSTQAKASKKPAAKKTAGQASATDKKAQTEAKPPRSTQAKSSKKPAAKKTAGQASASGKKAQTGGKPPTTPIADTTAAPAIKQPTAPKKGSAKKTAGQASVPDKKESEGRKTAGTPAIKPAPTPRAKQAAKPPVTVKGDANASSTGSETPAPVSAPTEQAKPAAKAPRAIRPKISTKVSTSSFYNDQVRVSVEEYVGEAKPYRVTTTFSLTGGVSLSGEASRGGSSANANVGASGTITTSKSTWMSEPEKNQYLASVAGGHGGNQPELTIIELIARGNYEAASEALRRVQDQMSDRQTGNVGDTEEISQEGDIQGSAGLGAEQRNGAGASIFGHVGLGAGKGIRRSRTLMADGTELYAIQITKRSSQAIGGGGGFNAVSAGYDDARNDSEVWSVSFSLDPRASEYSARKSEILAATTVEELNSIAARNQKLVYGSSASKDKSKTGTLSASVFGVFGLDLDQGEIDEEAESQDPSGKVRKLKGGSSLGGALKVLGFRINPETRTDSFSAAVSQDNTATGVTQSENRQVDYKKSAVNIAESFSDAPVGTALAVLSGNKPVLKDRVDTTGQNLTDDSFERVSRIAENPRAWFSAWNMHGVSHGASEEWEATRQAVLNAKGDRYAIAQALKAWEKGDSGRSGDVERLAGDTGIAFDFPDEIADQKPIYDQLMSPNAFAAARALAAAGQTKEAIDNLNALNERLMKLLLTVQGQVTQASDAGKFSAMQTQISARRRAVFQEIATIQKAARTSADSAGSKDDPAKVDDSKTPEPTDSENAQTPADLNAASDEIETQVRICLTNRVVEDKVFAEVADELDSVFINHYWCIEKLNSLKPMYANWAKAIEILKVAYPKFGDPASRADQFAPNYAKWDQLNQQALR